MVNSINLDPRNNRNNNSIMIVIKKNRNPRNNRAGFLKAVYLTNRKVIIFCNLMLLIVKTKTTSNTGSNLRNPCLFVLPYLILS